MVVTKCVFTSEINTYELILKNEKGYLSYCGENGKYAYVHNRSMKHLVFLVTSAGISTLDVYEGNPKARFGRESEVWECQRKWIEHKQKVMDKTRALTGFMITVICTYNQFRFNLT